jgi:hypothetical protein
MATSVPGVHLIDQFPRLARAANLFSVVRSVSHKESEHSAAAYLALTGRTPPKTNLGILPAANSDFPALGSVLAKIRPTDGLIPPYVLAPNRGQNLKVRTPGYMAGFLGGTCDPFLVTQDSKSMAFRIPALDLPPGIDPSRMAARRALKATLEQRLEGLAHSQMAQNVDSFSEQAFGLISSPQARNAFAVEREPAAIQERYGRHQLGKSLLLARRLIEAGVRIVMVNDADAVGDVFRWDTHGEAAVPVALKRNLPETDVALSALLEDLHDRGMLESTTVAWMGEMGRTPRDRTGHWPQCYSAVLAGGGVQGGRVYGSSDGIGAYPKDGRCGPADLHATIYRSLGLPSDTTIIDESGRPIPLFAGEPIKSLF